MNSIIKQFISIAVILHILAACETPSVSYEKMTDQQIYTLAYQQFNHKEYQKSKISFLKVGQEYPYSQLVPNSQIMAALSAYKNKNYAESLVYLDNFIDLYPSNSKIDYAYYLRIQNYYDQILSITHDQESTQKTLDACIEMLNRFPHSPYANIVKKKKNFSIEQLAGHNMLIGRFYEKREDYISSIQRFQYVITTYPTSYQIPEAIYRLIECYIALGLRNQAIQTMIVLDRRVSKHNIWAIRAHTLLNNTNAHSAHN